MSDERFPSQDPLEAAKIIASDEYQQQKTEDAEKKAQAERLQAWLGDESDPQRAAKVAKYLESRPYESEEGIHDPATGEVVEGVDRHTAHNKRAGRWGNRYFENRRGDHYDKTHEKSPAEWPLVSLFEEYIEAEADGDKTFMQDYAEALTSKLQAEDVKPSELGKLLAEAEFEQEVSDTGAPLTAKIVAGVLEDKVKQELIRLHNANLGESLEDAEAREAGYRQRLDRIWGRRLTELRKQNAALIEKRRAEQSQPDEDDGSEDPTTELADETGSEPRASEDATEVKPPKDDGDESAPDNTDQSQADDQESEEEAERRKSIERVQRTLNKWNERLQDPHYVPTPYQYEEMTKLAKQIDFRHMDPEADGQGGMGYFIGGSDVPLNSRQARGLLDKVKTGEWILKPADLEKAHMIVGTDYVADIPRSSQRYDRNDLISLTEFGEDRSTRQTMARSFQDYKQYVQGRLDLDKYLHENYEPEPRSRGKTPEAIKEFKDSAAESPREVAAGGLRSVTQKIKERANRNKQVEDEEGAERDEAEKNEAQERPRRRLGKLATRAADAIARGYARSVGFRNWNEQAEEEPKNEERDSE